MPHKHPYTCPRCGYVSKKKCNINKHLMNLQKPCPAVCSRIELTDEIKQCILDNRVYIPYGSKQMTQTLPKPTSIDTYVYKKACIPQTVRIACWNTYIGEYIGKTLCLCCKSGYITQHQFHCGHLIAEANGGIVSIENLRPICSSCNQSMRTSNMKEFAKTHFNVDIE